MNYEESLVRLKRKKEELEQEGSFSAPSFFGGKREWKEKEMKQKWKLVTSVIEGYSQSFSKDINSEIIEKVFNEIEGFTKQKKDVKRLLLTKNYFKKKGIKVREKGKIIFLVGPPGVGKTHFSKAIAKAMGRKFFKIALGGENDPQVIAGSDPTWVEAKYGRIIQAIIETKSCDPVILLDEVEKMGKHAQHGSPEDALLHVLDPEQNQEFKDKFLDIELDISRITFVLTANNLEKLSNPLKNRLGKPVELKGFKETEKLSIGKLKIEKLFREDYSNLNKDLFEMKDEALIALIGKVKEEGVRQLEGEIENIVHWCFEQWASQNEKGEPETKILIDEAKLNEIVSEIDGGYNKDDEKDTELRKKIDELKEENEKLKSDSEKIKEEIKQLQKFKDSNYRQDWGLVGLPWAVGGGIALTLFGCFCGWFLTKKFKKKKKNSQLKLCIEKSQVIFLKSNEKLTNP